MIIHAHEFLLNETRTLRKAQALVGERPGERFNIFQILGLESDEVYTHSQFLAEMLSPNGTHGLGDTFLKLWLTQLGVDNFESNDAVCTAEHYIGQKTQTDGGRIDLLIQTKSGKIIIENKIFAGDQENQLLRYFNYDKNAKLYYLTLFGTEPSEESTGKGLLQKEQYTCISYARDVLQWMEQCRKEAADIPILRESITQYIALIKKLTNQHFDGKMQTELVKKILSNRDNLTSFFELQSPGITQAVYEEVIKNWRASLQGLAEELHLKLNFYFPERKRYTGFTFYGNSDLEALNIWIDFQFDQFPNGIKYGYSFPPNTEKKPSKPNLDLSPLIGQFKAANPGSKSHEWWPVYTYWNYPGTEVCNDIYFSTAFIENVRDKTLQMLEIARNANSEIQGRDMDEK